MFSYLRPHRRTPSTPTSPTPDQIHSWDPPLHPTIDHAHPTRPPPGPPDNIPPQNPLSASSSPPPSLPPIARVSSPTFEAGYGYRNEEAAPSHAQETSSFETQNQWSQKPNQDIPPEGQQRLQWPSSRRPDTAGGAFARSAVPSNTQPNTSATRQPATREKSSIDALPFVTATDLQLGRRPAGARMPTPPPAPVPNVSSNFESHKPSKTRLNLLNPMSLLARRRASQAVPYLKPLPTGQNTSQQVKQEPSYDPRIRGTRVHDFSAPRPRRNVSHTDAQSSETGEYVNGQYPRSPNTQNGEFGIRIVEEDQQRWSGGNHTPVFTEDFDDEQYPAAGPHVRKANHAFDLSVPRPPYAKGAQQLRPNTAQPTRSQPLSTQADQLSRIRSPRTSLTASDGPPTPGPPVPPKGDDVPIMPRRLEDRRVSHTSIVGIKSPTSVKGSRNERSRNVSNFSTKEAASSGFPNHMKSTSSRFSFDMIGAASQEKLLEDRHRKKALEKSSSPDGHGQDEEEDDYDYDNMMDDDGLEEEIPMMNADLYEDGPYEEPIPGMDDDYEEAIPGMDDGYEEPIPGMNDGYEEPIPGMNDGYEEPLPGMNDGYEEPLPSRNDGQEEEEAGIERHSNGMGGFTFQSSSISATSPNTPYSPGMVSTPRDANGEIIGFAMTKESPQVLMHKTLQSATPLESPVDPEYKTPLQAQMNHGSHGLGLQGVEVSHDGRQTIEKVQQNDPSAWKPSTNANIEDDLYFDDGLIDDLDDGDERHEFDESVFDTEDTDEYGRPLRPLSSLPTLYSPPYVKDTAIHDQGRLESERSSRLSQDLLDHDTSGSPTLQQVDITASQSKGKKPELDQYGIPVPQGAPSLTQDTLTAYQSALAAAANHAAANGRFRRDSSPQVQFSEQNDQSAKPQDSGHLDSDLSLPYYPDEQDDFDYDDALEDDDIVAEANREALANDSDGFYGQEFGFYSAPAANGEAKYGGFFGPRGVDGIVRSQSGRIAGREPNLTPITERSEYSNRNSFMSLPLSGISQLSPTGHSGPGLAQLAGMLGEFDDDNMSLTALLRLRRGAWGGSQASLISSHGSPMSAGGEDASPVNQLSPWGQNSGAFAHARKNSTFSLASDVPSHVSEEGESEIEESAPSSPKLTMGQVVRPNTIPSPTKKTFGTASHGKGVADLAKSGVHVDVGRIDVPLPSSGLMDRLHNRPISPVMKRHRHTGSADSISYMKEDDPIQGERWVLERRRTAESGEVEILGREVVKGGRI